MTFQSALGIQESTESLAARREKVGEAITDHLTKADGGCFCMRMCIMLIEFLLIPEVPYTQVIYALFNHIHIATTKTSCNCVLNRFPSLLLNLHVGVDPLHLFLISTYR